MMNDEKIKNEMMELPNYENCGASEAALAGDSLLPLLLKYVTVLRIIIVSN